jgi:hypothetical protein
MAINHGPRGTIITAYDINSISLTNASVVTASTGNYSLNGGYQITTLHSAVGCGSTGVYLELKDNISWNYMSFQFTSSNLVSACWSFCTGGYAPASGNINSYDETKGDIVFTSQNAWEKSQFQTHDKQGACDNNSDNFLHGSFYTGFPIITWMRRRRNVNGSLAGIALGFACTNGGTISISNIRIF